MNALAGQVRSMVGAAVSVETDHGTVLGTLLSATNRSLWLVAGEDDVVLLLREVRSVRRLYAA